METEMNCAIFKTKSSSCSVCIHKSEAVGILGKDELNLLDHNCVEVSFKGGEMIFKQSSFSSHVIFIQSGLVKIHMTGINGKDQILKVVPSPTYLGLANLFGDTINNYSASAIEETKACFIHIDIFKQFIQSNGQFALEIIKYISREELTYFKRFVNHNQKQIDGRLAETILFFMNEVYKSNQFNLPLNRKDLSTLVCASRESVIREIQSLAANGIIEIKGKNITVLNKERLEQISRNG